MNFSVALQLLDQFCHQHRVLAAGNTDSDFIPFLNQLILIQRFGKLAPDGFPKFLNDAPLNFSGFVFFFLFGVFCHKPAQAQAEICPVAAFNIHCMTAHFQQALRIFLAPLSGMAQHIDGFILWQLLCLFFKFIHGKTHCSRPGSSVIFFSWTDISHYDLVCIQFFQFFNLNGFHFLHLFFPLSFSCSDKSTALLYNKKIRLGSSFFPAGYFFFLFRPESGLPLRFL